MLDYENNDKAHHPYLFLITIFPKKFPTKKKNTFFEFSCFSLAFSLAFLQVNKSVYIEFNLN